MENIGSVISAAATIIFVVFAVFAAIISFSRLYKKAAPNEVLVVYGRRGYRVIKGGGTLVFPIIENLARMSLEVMTIPVGVENVWPMRLLPAVCVPSSVN